MCHVKSPIVLVLVVVYIVTENVSRILASQKGFSSVRNLISFFCIMQSGGTRPEAEEQTHS